MIRGCHRLRATPAQGTLYVTFIQFTKIRQGNDLFLKMYRNFFGVC